MLACIKLTDRDSEIVKNVPISRAESIVKQHFERFDYFNAIDEGVLQRGVPMQKFSKDYIEKNVKPVFDRLNKQYPFDPASVPQGKNIGVARNKHINSLRNRAEMEVRYNGHLENIEQLRKQGNKLVIASEHADCSERCAKWQGKVFSLDGTSGVTPDGRKYQPLENATNVEYTTKAGKVYKNGLLGFNCRHFLVPYKDGYKFPKTSKELEKKEYKITQHQRYLERQVRYWRNEALMSKGVMPEYHQIAKNTAIEYNKEYIKYSHDNGRAYYPSRTKLI